MKNFIDHKNFVFHLFHWYNEGYLCRYIPAVATYKRVK